ncbi:MAG: transposase [Actinobacteria bacterium]|nr:transposase [Actinomycetota bacterium]
MARRRRRADTGEVLHIRFRTGKANTQRGVIRFVDELVARVRAAGATGPILLRADSGFHNKALRARLAAKGVAYSIAARMTKRVAAAITAIADEHWQTLTDYSATGHAQIAETVLDGERLIARRWKRTPKGNCSRPGSTTR